MSRDAEGKFEMENKPAGSTRDGEMISVSSKKRRGECERELRTATAPGARPPHDHCKATANHRARRAQATNRCRPGRGGANAGGHLGRKSIPGQTRREMYRLLSSYRSQRNSCLRTKTKHCRTDLKTAHSTMKLQEIILIRWFFAPEPAGILKHYEALFCNRVREIVGKIESDSEINDANEPESVRWLSSCPVPK